MLVSIREICDFHCPVYGVEFGKIRVFGTLTLVRLEGKPYCITCNHVVEFSEKTNLYVPGSTGLKEVNFEGHSTKNMRDPDNLDFAILNLKPHEEKLLSENFKFYDFKQNLNVRPTGSHYYVCGYPKTKTRVRSEFKTIRSKPFSTFTTKSTISGVNEYTEQENLFLNFDVRMFRFHDSKEGATPPPPEGISGGGFRRLIGNPADPENMKAELEAIGVEHIHDKINNLLVGTDINVALREMTRRGVRF